MQFYAEFAENTGQLSASGGPAGGQTFEKV